MSAVVKFVEKRLEAIKYFLTGTYKGTEGNDHIVAVSMNLGWGRGILTKGGDDDVIAAAFNLKVIDTTGYLNVVGAGGYTEIYKEGEGNLDYVGAAGGLLVEHTGESGDLNLASVALSSTALRKGRIGNLTAGSLAAHTSFKLHTKVGDLTFAGGAAYLKLERKSNGYANSRGNLTINGAGAWVEAISTVDTGDMTGFTLAGNGKFTRYGKDSNVDLNLIGINNEVRHYSITGDTKVEALGGRNYIEKKGREFNDNSSGDLIADVAGLRNEIIHATRFGDTTVSGLAISSKITRIGEEGDVTISGVGIDNEINIKMKKGALEFKGVGASNRITIEGLSGDLIDTSSVFKNDYTQRENESLLLSYESFEKGDTSGWSSEIITEKGELTKFLGGFGNTDGEQAVYKTYSFGIQNAGREVELSFKFYEIDSKDDGFLNTYINDEIVIHGAEDGVKQKTSEENGSEVKYTKKVVLDENGKVKLGFGATLDESINESWGIDDVQFRTAGDWNSYNLVSESYEDSDISGWVNKTNASTLTQTSSELGNFLGRFGGTSGKEGIFKTFEFGVEQAGKTVEIEFDMYEIDSWDDEEFRVFINGEQKLAEKLNSDKITGTKTSSNVFNSYTDEIHHYKLEAVVDADGKVRLGFGSTLNQDISDESYGIDNLKINTGYDWNSKVLLEETFEGGEALGWNSNKDGKTLKKKTNNSDWNAGAFSQESLEGDGEVSTTVLETNKSRMIGFSSDDSSKSYDTIDYAVYLEDSGNLKVYEKGVHKGTFGNYKSGDTLSVKRTGNVITYLKNDQVFYTSSVASSGELHVDTSLRHKDATLSEIELTKSTYEIPTLINQEGVSVSGNNITKTSSAGWNAGSFSEEFISDDGKVSTTVLETNKSRMIGFSSDDSSKSYDTIDYAVYLEDSGNLKVYENGENKGTFGSYKSGDTLSVQRTGNVISYLKNDQVFYTSTIKSYGNLYVDTSFRHKDATLKNITLTQLDTQTPTLINDEGVLVYDSAARLTTHNNLTDFLGRFGGSNGEQAVYKTYNLGIQNAGKMVELSFDMYELDSWDNECFITFVNDKIVVNEGFIGKEITGERVSSNVFNTYDDEMHRYTLEAKVDNNGQIKIGFGSTLDQNINDESYGIDNIKLKTIGDWEEEFDEGFTESSKNGDILIKETFDGEEVTGWTNNQTTKTDSELGEFLGRMGGTSGKEGLSKTFNLGIQNAGKTVDIEFDMYEIDSWDNEEFSIFINGEEKLVEKLRQYEITGTKTSSNVFNKYNDEIHHYSIKATVDKNGEVKLGFGSTLNESIDNESWGIDNVTLSKGANWNEKVIVNETFDGGVAKGWSNNTTSRTESEMGDYLGRFGGTNGNQGLYKTFNLGAENAGRMVNITFDMYEIDSWDNEEFKVFVNDNEVINETMAVGTITGTATSANVYKSWGSEDMHSYSLQAQVDENGNIKLGFGSTLNESIDNESWGIDNVKMTTIGDWEALNKEANTSRSRILSSENFEEGSAKGWSNTKVSQTNTELGSFLGRMGGTKGNEGVFKTYDFGLQNAGQVVDINFDMYEIDSWDNEEFRVFINGEQELAEKLHVGEITGTKTSSNVFNKYNDEIHHYTLQATLDDKGQVRLGFGSTLNQNIDDESWGIDNVVIKKSGQWENGNTSFTTGENAFQINDTTQEIENDENYSANISLAGLYNKVVHTTKAGDIVVNGGGGYTEVTREAEVHANLTAELGGIANVVKLEAKSGDYSFKGLGAANILTNNSENGTTNIVAAGIGNIVNRRGDGSGRLIMIGGANVVKWKGNGDIKAFMLGGANVLLKRNNGGIIYALMAGGINYIGQVGSGDLYAGMLGGANVIVKSGDGDAYSLMAGGLNVLVHVGDGTTAAVMLGVANVLTKVGDGLTIGALFGGANIFTHVGNGDSVSAMIGGANIFTKVGGKEDDLTLAVMIGVGNVFTHKGDGDSIAIMAGGINVFTKIGGKLNGNGIADDDLTIAAMFSAGNIFTHVGDGTTAALMVGTGNVLTKVGEGLTVGVMVGAGNILTHVGNGTTLALMAATGNIFTKVGNGITVAAMLGKGNIFTHVGNGTTGAVMLGLGNIFTKVGDGPALAVMLTPPSETGISVGNIFTHVGDGISGALMFGGVGNIFTKVGDGLTVAAMIKGEANIFTHVGDGTSVAIMALSKANVFTKVGDGLTVALMQGDLNVMTHVGDGLTAAIAIGKANIITKVGNDELVTALYGKANVVTHISSEQSNTYALLKGNLNVVTKVGPMDDFSVTVAPLDGIVADPVAPEDRILARGDISSNPMGVVNSVISGMETLVDSTVSDVVNGTGGVLSGLVLGDANVITHVGRGATNIVAHGKANIITKVGNGRSVVLANGKANILSVVGDGDSIQAANGKANIITKVGSGSSAVIAKGEANIVTKVGDGLHIGIMSGKLNVQTIVGDGMNISAQKGDLNINTKVGDGTNISIAKGQANLNIQFGDGLGIYAAAGRGNVSIKIGNGDYYGIAYETGKKGRVQALLSELKGTSISLLASGTIATIVNGSEEGTVTGHGHTVPNIEAPSELKGISVSQTDDSTSNVDSSNFAQDATRTNESGNQDDYDENKKDDIEGNSQSQSQAAIDAQNNATSDANRAKSDIAEGQAKVESEKEKIDSFENDINDVDDDELEQNASDIKSLIGSELTSSGSDFSTEDNIDTIAEGSYEEYKKEIADGSNIRAEFSTINSDVNEHLDTYGKQVQDAMTSSNEENPDVDIQDTIDDAQEKYIQAKSDEIKANKDANASQSNVNTARNEANSATNEASAAKNEAEGRADSASNGEEDKTKSNASASGGQVSEGRFESEFNNPDTSTSSDSLPEKLKDGIDEEEIKNGIEAGAAALNVDIEEVLESIENVDGTSIEDELDAAIEALRANTGSLTLDDNIIKYIAEKYSAAKNLATKLNELRKIINESNSSTNDTSESTDTPTNTDDTLEKKFEVQGISRSTDREGALDIELGALGGDSEQRRGIFSKKIR